jgi:hemoglobin-like flavoprotein
VTDPGAPHPTGPAVAPDVLELLTVCADDLAPVQQALVLVLHGRLLEVTPGIVHQAGSGRPMCQRVAAAVLHAARADRQPSHAAAVVQQVGADNYVEGFPTDHYGVVTPAVLHSVREVFRGEWSTSLSSAWVEYLLWFRGHLITGAEAQRAHDEAQAETPVHRRTPWSGSDAAAGRDAGASPQPEPAPKPEAAGAGPVRRTPRTPPPARQGPRAATPRR